MPSCEQSVRQEERNPQGIQRDVFNNPFASANGVSSSYGRVPPSWEKSATHGDLVQPSTSEPVFSPLHGRHLDCKYEVSVFADTSMERLVTKSEEQTRDTIPTPRFAKRPSTGIYNCPPEGVYSQNHMVDPRFQVSELRFDNFPTPSSFSRWKIGFKTQVSVCSVSPSEAMLLTKEVELVD